MESCGIDGWETYPQTSPSRSGRRPTPEFPQTTVYSVLYCTVTVQCSILCSAVQYSTLYNPCTVQCTALYSNFTVHCTVYSTVYCAAQYSTVYYTLYSTVYCTYSILYTVQYVYYRYSLIWSPGLPNQLDIHCFGAPSSQIN